MAWGVNSVMTMGVGALFASQASIQTTGNNIANVNTPGYSRQAVVLTERYSLDFVPGQVGQGVEAKEVIRYFDKFIEKNYLSKLGTSSRYAAAYNQMRNVEELFNEANVDGLGAATSDFFAAWNKLVQNPDDMAARQALLASAGIVTDAVNITDRALLDLEEQLNSMIRQEVNAANQLIKEIAAINNEIATSYLEGRNNPNQLMDERDKKVRELGAIIDVSVQDDDPRHYRVTMANGTVLVQDNVPFSLTLKGPNVENNLTANSTYKEKLDPNDPASPAKSLHFNGFDSKEYLVEIVDAGAVDGGATFRVSIDGGKSWLKNDDGSVAIFNANEEADAVRVGALDIYFDAGNLSAGDKFVISPKTDIYWVSPTSGPMNVSTQIFPDGSDNSSRITGGSLGGYLQVRDNMIGEYRDRLDAFSKSMAWEVNRIHSQGAGLEPMNYAMGTYAVGNIGANLADPEARFTWSDYLQPGNLTFTIFDAAGNNMLPNSGITVFFEEPTGVIPEGYNGNFDPSLHSLEAVRNAINNAYYTDDAGVRQKPFQATIIDGKLELSMAAAFKDCSFAITADTAGLTAALGINTFFVGDSSDTLAVRGDLFTNANLINAGRLDGQGEINPGDNQTAREITGLAAKAVSIGTTWDKNTKQSLSEYYGGIITKVGADTQSVKFTAATESSMAQELYVRQEEISGVNLDEEMTNLIKFQASYKAAAKLITTADEMLQTLLSLKQ
ncbi:flagellar hook-associated protein FlgK [Desulfovibrio sp. OttesenSCG-928-G11]|nr:flagellar hook-associated protein FlgK [Desulfovibrio sp. OttesenSCG-928-G11]